MKAAALFHDPIHFVANTEENILILHFSINKSHRRSQGGTGGNSPQESKFVRAPKTEGWKALFHMKFYSLCLTKNFKFITSEYTKIHYFETKK